MKWHECWFLTNPEEFQYTHIPLSNNNEVEVKNLLIAKPVVTLEEWANQVQYDTIYAGKSLSCVPVPKLGPAPQTKTFS